MSGRQLRDPPRARAGPAGSASAPPRPALRGTPGRPLDRAARAYLEPRLGHDFSAVRVHTDPPAAEAARAVRARAFTVGDDLVFGAGQYRPGSTAGLRLLAHELAHVVQQRQPGSGVGAEGRAEAAVDRVAGGQAVAPAALGGASGPQRAPDDAAPAPVGPAAPRTPLVGGLHVTLGILDGFELNSDLLGPANQARVRGLAEMALSWLRGVPAVVITLVGHTDATGGEAGNLRLGVQRAESVRRALVAAGVPAVSIETVSLGERAPLVSTGRDEPRNRRVEVRVQQPVGAAAPPAVGLASPSWVDLPPTLRPPPPGSQLFPPGWPGGSGGQGALAPPGGAAQPRLGEQARARQATPGDLLKALYAVPSIKQKVDRAVEEQKAKLGRLSPGEKAAAAAVAIPIALGGILPDPEVRNSVLQALDGQEVAVDWLVPGAKVQARTEHGVGLVLNFDLTRWFPRLK